MNRRAFLQGCLATTAALSPILARAAETCTPIYCDVGLPNIVMTPAQQCQQWCWAACIQAIFGLNNHPIDQRVIVQKLFGGLICAPANNPQMFAAINGQWIDSNGQQFHAQADVLYDPLFHIVRHDALPIMINELRYGRPLINGAVGHATVLTAIRYRNTPAGPQVISATIRDPWPLNPNRRLLMPHEMMGTTFIARVMVT